MDWICDCHFNFYGARNSKLSNSNVACKSASYISTAKAAVPFSIVSHLAGILTIDEENLFHKTQK
jgi:hypothetical protein